MPKAKASSASPIARWLSQLWHLTDSVRWMDPLPPFHRRGIVIAIIVVLLAFLWPSTAPQQPLWLTNDDLTVNKIPLHAELSKQQDKDAQRPAASQGQWFNYRIASGQTLAQLFRDHNLPINDVFAMARVEGSDMPLSNLQAGQAIRIRQNVRSVVTGLAVSTNEGEILFIRQPDGSFLRVH